MSDRAPQPTEAPHDPQLPPLRNGALLNGRAHGANAAERSARFTVAQPAPRFILGGFLLLALLFFGVQLAAGDRIVPNVTVLGVPVGGMSRAEAAAAIDARTRAILDRPIVLRGAGRAWRTTPAELGLRLAGAPLADAAYQIGRRGSLFDRIGEQVAAYLGGYVLDPADELDRSALDAYVQRLAREIDRAPRDARLAFDARGKVAFTPAETGQALQVAESRDRILAALASDAPAVDLVVREVPPAVPSALLEAARAQLETMFSGPLVVGHAEKRWTIPVETIARWTTLETPPGRPAVVKIDQAAVTAFAEQLAREIEQQPQNARFLWNGGNLKPIREGREGRKLDVQAGAQAILAGLIRPERSLALPVEVTPPAVPSDDIAKLGIVELIDRGQTSFKGSIPEKKHNIRLAAERLNGVVVPPGGTFSFNQEVGPTTLEAGFKWGFGITSANGGKEVRTVPSVAGGICQVATTLFQPVFWSGYQLEERHWHLYWIPAYTSRGVVGLDVTVDEESGLDFKFINPTDSYLLIQAATDEENLYFALYGKKPAWKVEVDEPVITNRRPPDTRPVFQPEPTLPWGQRLAVEQAREGFDVTVVRRVITPDGSERTLRLRSSYQPSRTVTLIGTKGMPSDVDLEALLADARGDENKPVRGEGEREPKPSTTPGAGQTPAPTPQQTAGPAPKPSPTARPAPTPTPRPAAAPTAPPKPQPSPTPTPKKP